MVYDTRAVTQACDRQAPAGDTIVVCGRRDKDKYRVPRLPDVNADYGVAETSVAGAKVGVETEQVDVGGFPSNRVMVRVKVPF